jgi:hypothetical protein
MNTTQNKAALWKSCIEQGIFDQLPSGIQPQVQGLFESTISEFNQEGMDPAIANQLVLKEFKIKLGKMIGKQFPQKSFDEINQEYMGQFKPRLPDKIEFSKEKDSPLENMDEILKNKAEQRQNEIHEFFKEEQKGMELTEVLPSVSMPSLSMNSVTTPIEKTQPVLNLSSEIVLHRRILESILQSQIKIIEMLQQK